MNTNEGCMGKDHDARLLKRSGVYLSGREGTLFPQNDMVINRVSVSLLFWGIICLLSAMANETLA